MLMTPNYIYQWRPDKTDQLLKLQACLKDIKAWDFRYATDFLRYQVKETVLKNPWQKKVQLEGKPLAFNHDYMAAVVQQRRAYKDVKRALKENSICFQTPFTKIRIHWESGPQIYINATQTATRKLQQREYEVSELQGSPEADTSALLLHLGPVSPCQPTQRLGNSKKST
ncbi:hypothetical protein L3Q82_023443 [Scortum barcoo]|uniref:Uncharacterized protein n=1 Tax=Scortum barcoo TaxID=214431 RepID=A0ACB8WYU5_9TELE|nr:hypothetical protein L3Q82_023443 [Scortum barcoo]